MIAACALAQEVEAGERIRQRRREREGEGERGGGRGKGREWEGEVGRGGGRGSEEVEKKRCMFVCIWCSMEHGTAWVLFLIPHCPRHPFA